eukprot:scaffold1778_cov246-Pinguiococcus_pyrenoidosus.AAC.5
MAIRAGRELYRIPAGVREAAVLLPEALEGRVGPVCQGIVELAQRLQASNLLPRRHASVHICRALAAPCHAHGAQAKEQGRGRVDVRNKNLPAACVSLTKPRKKPTGLQGVHLRHARGLPQGRCPEAVQGNVEGLAGARFGKADPPPWRAGLIQEMIQRGHGNERALPCHRQGQSVPRQRSSDAAEALGRLA